MNRIRIGKRLLSGITLIMLLPIGEVLAQEAGKKDITHSKSLSGALAGYQLAYEDDFNGNSLNKADWFYRHGNKKLGGGFNRSENVSIVSKDGVGYLDIAYKKDTDYNNDGVADLSGGGVISTKAFGYGYYEARIKFYKGSKGLHESFWNHGLALNVNDTGDMIFSEAVKRDLRPTDNVAIEIDAIELDSYMNLGKTNYWFNKKACDCTSESTAAAFNRFDASYMDLDQWINVGFEWLPGMVKYYINGVERYRYSFTTPSYAAMEVWLTALANTLWFKGEPLPDASMKVDYFRYYHKPTYANLIGNNSFEFDGAATETVRNWIIYDGIYDNEKTDGCRVVYDGTAYEGKGYLQQDGKSSVPYIASKYQLDYIPNSTYKLTAWIKRSAGMQKATMEVLQPGAKTLSVNIPPATQWTKITLENITVGSNTATVVFNTTGADGEWLKIDKVELFDMTVKNPVKQWPLIVQELEDGYSESGPFRGSFNFSPHEGGIWGNAVKGYNSSSIRMSNGDAGLFAQWSPVIPAKGNYDVYIYKPVSKDADSNAKIEIKYDGGTTVKYLDYTAGQAGWVFLGNYKFTEGKTNYIRNYVNTKDKKILADAIAVTPTGEKAPTLE
ncbi:hypothetical protein [Flavobacterium sp. JAS]|uniref:golvesin C-terminal-like domain-containing protein n=1 Tax=Flavobacterium sp. JAS TaxID=2897329 RepID=UPI001E42A838|nr:hypothetical protein [Flavobacterium sp. JAS]MCD0472333.1 hypothetical protein [Flavobacterium sp. JAS]